MTNTRTRLVSRSIHHALLQDPEREVITRYNVFTVFLVFFSVWNLRLVRVSAHLFHSLRCEAWNLDETAYIESFITEKNKSGAEGMKPMGDLGFSGSTFFKTVNSKFLIKSLPRRSEHSFFSDEFLLPYYRYMKSKPDSLLVHITDFLGVDYPAVGTLCRCTPSHHVIMENVLSDRQDSGRAPDKWETYDLKPTHYFYPERDLMPKPLKSEATVKRLYDEFKDKVRITKQQYDKLRKTIAEDTKLLCIMNAVDYSLFLIRYPAHLHPQTPAYRKVEWREGALSTDGKWRYRAVLLDFFWAKHKLQAQAMTGIVQTFNAIGRQGPMSITTTPEEYRDKFLQMLDGMVELQG